MSLILFSLILALITGCCLWLVFGEILPVSQEEKWPVTNNIVCYCLILFPLIYLVIFFLA